MQWFLLIKKLNSLQIDLKDVFSENYTDTVIESIEDTIEFLKENMKYESRGINFLIGKKRK